MEKANRLDAKEITELTMRSKNHWNYGAKQIEEWRAEMTITPKYIDDNQVYKITNGESLIGFYAYQANSPENVKLNFLFVEPSFIGQGYGKILIADFLKRIGKDGYKSATLDADPNAEKFYKRAGFKTIGKLETSIEGRFLPIMKLELKA